MNFQNVCRHNKFGFCKHGQSCRKRHVDELCNIESCDINICEKRHPRSCRFFAEYGRCKFLDFCKYKHVNNMKNESSVDNEMKIMFEKQTNMENEIKELNEMLKLKDDQILAIALKIDTILDFLKNKDIEEIENSEAVHLHELDEDLEYAEKVHKIDDEKFQLSDDSENNEQIAVECSVWDKDLRREIQLFKHMWDEHGGKVSVTAIRKTFVT